MRIRPKKVTHKGCACICIVLCLYQAKGIDFNKKTLPLVSLYISAPILAGLAFSLFVLYNQQGSHCNQRERTCIEQTAFVPYKRESLPGLSPLRREKCRSILPRWIQFSPTQSNPIHSIDFYKGVQVGTLGRHGPMTRGTVGISTVRVTRALSRLGSRVKWSPRWPTVLYFVQIYYS